MIENIHPAAELHNRATREQNKTLKQLVQSLASKQKRLLENGHIDKQDLEKSLLSSNDFLAKIQTAQNSQNLSTGEKQNLQTWLETRLQQYHQLAKKLRRTRITKSLEQLSTLRTSEPQQKKHLIISKLNQQQAQLSDPNFTPNDKDEIFIDAYLKSVEEFIAEQRDFKTEKNSRQLHNSSR